MPAIRHVLGALPELLLGGEARELRSSGREQGDPGDDHLHAQVRKRYISFAPFHTKNAIVLPRQARENIGKAALKKRDGAFSDSHFFFCPNGPRLLMEPREMPAPVPIEGSTEIEWPIMCTETSLDAQCFDFTKGLAVVIVGLASLVRNTPLFEPFCTENDHFTKTGSGQT